VVTGRYDGPVQGMMSVAIGVGAILAAMSLPTMLLGSLARANVAPGMLSTALNVAAMLSGFGLVRGVAAAAPVARATAVFPGLATGGAGAAVVYPATTGSGYVRSLLAGAPARLALPPPKP
jgi:hypothetical protein